MTNLIMPNARELAKAVLAAAARTLNKTNDNGSYDGLHADSTTERKQRSRPEVDHSRLLPRRRRHLTLFVSGNDSKNVCLLALA